MPPILEVNDLWYAYGNITVVKGINIHVNEGEIVTLIGANGAGKTTTLRTISGLTDPKGLRGGAILFKGEKIDGQNGDKITKKGLVQVLEGRHIFSKLSVYENLTIGAYTRNDKKSIKEDIKRVYKRFPRLEERKNQMGGTLSGGEQQMLAIARAQMSNPKMLLLDEPSLGLAPIIIKEIFEAIKEISREGTTVMFVEQNAKIALETASRGYVLQTGEIILEDKCEGLIHNKEVQKVYLGVR
jgi:branched-chain amino acid transport system ATP-binding protein